MEKTLIIAPNWIGDFVMMSSLIEILRQDDQHQQIDIVALPYCVGLARFMKIDTIHSFQLSPKELPLLEMCKFAKKIKALSYTRCFILPDALKYAIIPFLARIPTRIGWNFEHRSLLLTHTRRLPFKEFRSTMYDCLDNSYARHSHKFVEKYQLLPTLLSPRDESIPLSTPPRLHLLATKPASIFTTKKRRLVICSGSAEKPSKKWPYFYELLLQLSPTYEIALLGGKTELTEKLSFDRIISQYSLPDIHNLIDKIPLSDVPFIIDDSDIVITNDTGLMHIAAALSKKTIAIFGSSSELWTPPLSSDAHIIHTDIYCRPCMKKSCPLAHTKCMTEISVATILDKINQIS